MVDAAAIHRTVLAALEKAGVPLPGPLGQWPTFARFWRGGWRSTAAWVIVLILFINGAVLPIARLFGWPGEPLDWQGIAALALALPGMAWLRSRDLQAGVTT